MSEKKLIKVDELSEMISMPVYTIRKLVRDGVIPAYRLGRNQTFYDPTEVLEDIKSYPLA